MTAIDVTYRLTGELTLAQLRAVRQAFSVYGVRAIHVDEAAQRMTVEYDATRLNERQVAAILRAGGISLADAPDRPE